MDKRARARARQAIWQDATHREGATLAYDSRSVRFLNTNPDSHSDSFWLVFVRRVYSICFRPTCRWLLSFQVRARSSRTTSASFESRFHSTRASLNTNWTPSATSIPFLSLSPCSALLFDGQSKESKLAHKQLAWLNLS